MRRSGAAWRAWHSAYDAETPLRRRLAVVQDHIRDALATVPAGPIRVLSLCVGEARDLLEVLVDHPRREDVEGRLIELDSELAATARSNAPPAIEVISGDASTTDALSGAIPADLVLACGVFGNIAASDIQRTIGVLPSLCTTAATVIWTRHRHEPDMTGKIRRWFAAERFEEIRFDAPAEFEFGIGTHRYTGETAPFTAGVRMFTFLR